MNDINSAMESIKIGLSLLCQSIGLIKQVKELLPETQDKEAIDKSLEEANKAAKFAELQIAQALGYKLCKCTFPPQIMLSHGYGKDCRIEEFKCPQCFMSSIPPPHIPGRRAKWDDS